MSLDWVTAVEIHEAGKPSIEFRKKGLFWMLESPVYYPSAVAPWLQLLERANWVLRLSPEELQEGQGLDEFGLEPPTMRIVLHQGAERTEIKIGNTIPIGKQIYAQVGGSDDVFVTDELIFSALPESVDGWRNPALVSYSSQAQHGGKLEFGRVEVRSPERRFAVQPNPATGGWRLMDPINARADATIVLSLLYRLAPSWTVQEYVSDDPEEDVSQYGLDQPSLELAYMNGTNDILSVQFGNSPTNRPDLIYARQVQFTNVVLTARTNVAILQLPFTYWRDRHLIALNTNDVSEISAEYSFGDKLFSYRLESTSSNTWQMVEPERLPVDGELVRNFFDHMNTIRITEFEKDVVADFSQYGLEPAARTFSVGVKTNSTRTNGYPSLSFGTNGNNQAFACRSDEKSVYAIGLGDFGVLPVAHWQWRDRQIWSFTTNDVKSVIIEQHGRKREVMRTPEGRWLLAPGSSGVLDLSFEEAVYQMSRLSADRWAAKGGTNPAAQFGFTDPPHRVSFVVERNGTTMTNTVAFGGLRGGSDPFASVVLDDGVTWYFDFPLIPYYKHVVNSFVLSEGE